MLEIQACHICFSDPGMIGLVIPLLQTPYYHSPHAVHMLL